MKKSRRDLKPAGKSEKTAPKSKKGTPMIAEMETGIGESGVDYLENHPSRLRRGSVKIADIRENARILQEISLKLQGLATEMDRRALTALESVDGITKIDRGLQLCAQYAANLQRAVTDVTFGR